MTQLFSVVDFFEHYYGFWITNSIGNEDVLRNREAAEIELGEIIEV